MAAFLKVAVCEQQTVKQKIKQQNLASDLFTAILSPSFQPKFKHFTLILNGHLFLNDTAIYGDGKSKIVDLLHEKHSAFAFMS